MKYYTNLHQFYCGIDMHARKNIIPDFDAFLEIYNKERPHQGRNMNGRTPLQAFVEGIKPQPDKEEPAAS